MKEYLIAEKLFEELRECPKFREIVRNFDEKTFVVAGGFVADRFLSMKGGKDIKINDIDIFVVNKEDTGAQRTFEVSNKRNYLRTSSTDYSTMRSKFARILKTTRVDHYNIIELKLKDDGKALLTQFGWTDFWKIYIEENFDINSCMIYLDFHKDLLVKTPSFSDFELTKELKIVGSDCIFNSLTRMEDKSRKYKEVGVKYYREKWLEQAFFQNIGKKDLVYLRGDSLNKGSEFFNVERFKKLNISIGRLFAPYFIVAKQTYYTNSAEVILYPNWLKAPAEIYSLFCEIQSQERGTTNFQFFINHRGDVSSKDRTTMLGNILAGEESKKVNKLKIALTNILDNTVVFLKEYSNCQTRFNDDISNEKLIKVSNLFSQHKEMVKVSTKMFCSGWTLSEVVSFFFNVFKMKQHKNIFIGRLENGLADKYIEDIKDGKANVQSAFDSIFDAYLKERIATDKTLINPVSLELFKYHELVKELTTSHTLEDEGSYMNHCVGGYTFKVKQNESRIYHIKYKKWESTLEVIYDPFSGKIKSRQHFTFNNQQVNKLQKFIARMLVSHLNKLSKEGVLIFNKSLILADGSVAENTSAVNFNLREIPF